MISLGTPVSAETTWRFRNAVGVIQDHPRVGGDQALTVARLRPALAPLSETSPEGVITA